MIYARLQLPPEEGADDKEQGQGKALSQCLLARSQNKWSR